jgi:CYTH domain-containing protein
MAQEIERKFLLKQLPQTLLAEVEPANIKQGYLVMGQDRELRVRSIDGQAYFTSKRGQGLVREEIELPVDDGVFNLVWPFTEEKRIEKSRYTIKQDSATYDFDVYFGKLEGLQVLEVEFDSIDDAKAFSMPDYCVQEITDDNRYKNATLAVKGLP